jgi:ribosome biogenesis GTPase A
MTTIQWFPGHMTKARKVIAEAVPSQDVIIEIVDARMPRSSENPLFDELCLNKPRVLLLTKSDLADPKATALWLAYYNEQSKQRNAPRLPIAITTKRLAETRTRIVEAAKMLAVKPSGPGGIVRAMVVGIPNVGKSTLVNTLMGRTVAKVGNEPAVTKAKQQVNLPSGILLTDHPGLMWPKIEHEAQGYRLGLGGAIADNALEYETLGVFAAGLFRARYPESLKTRYKLADLAEDPRQLLTDIGKRRGCLEKGGHVNLHAAGDVLVHDFRNGALGRITLELPE